MNNVTCGEDERIDDLQRNGYRIIQKKKGFCFGMDAVLLSGFAQVKEGEAAVDLGTGTGIIPILLEAKTKGKHFTGLEIQEEVAEMAERSVRLNQLEARVDIVRGDIREASRLFGKASFDVVTSNPPYMNDNHGLKNPDLPKAIARHEVFCTLDDVCREASLLLKSGGRFYMVHRPHSLSYCSKISSPCSIFPIRKSMMKVEAPIIVYKEPGVYTQEIYDVYGY